MADTLAQFLDNKRACHTVSRSYVIADVGIFTVTTEFEPFDGDDDE